MKNETWRHLMSFESHDIVSTWFSRLHGRELSARILGINFEYAEVNEIASDGAASCGLKYRAQASNPLRKRIPRLVIMLKKRAREQR